MYNTPYKLVHYDLICIILHCDNPPQVAVWMSLIVKMTMSPSLDAFRPGHSVIRCSTVAMGRMSIKDVVSLCKCTILVSRCNEKCFICTELY